MSKKSKPDIIERTRAAGMIIDAKFKGGNQLADEQREDASLRAFMAIFHPDKPGLGQRVMQAARDTRNNQRKK